MTIRFPCYDPQFETEDIKNRTEEWLEEFRFYHWSKGQWQDIHNQFMKRSNRWWDDYREFYENRRGLAITLGEQKKSILYRYTRLFKPTVFIETGTLHGETSWDLKDHFEIVHTIEIEPELYEKAVDKFRDTNVVCHLGNSADILPAILKGLDVPALFWIDAHWCQEGDAPEDRQAPVIQELQAIFEHKVKNHIILIDDARYFGGPAERLSADEGYPDQDWVQLAAEAAGYQYTLERDIFRLTPP